MRGKAGALPVVHLNIAMPQVQPEALMIMLVGLLRQRQRQYFSELPPPRQRYEALGYHRRWGPDQQSSHPRRRKRAR